MLAWSIVHEPHKAQDLAKWPKFIQLYRKSNPRNSNSPGSCSFAKPFTGKGNKSNSTGETLTQLSASTLLHSTKALQKSAAPFPWTTTCTKNNVPSRIRNGEFARLIERDTQDFVRFGAQGAIDQDLDRACTQLLGSHSATFFTC